jgi:hypothetical protein
MRSASARAPVLRGVLVLAAWARVLWALAGLLVGLLGAGEAAGMLARLLPARPSTLPLGKSDSYPRARHPLPAG